MEDSHLLGRRLAQRIDRHPDHAHLRALLHRVAERGYARDTARRRVSWSLGLCEWLRHRGLTVSQIAPHHLDEFIATRHRHRFRRDAKPSFRLFVESLEATGAVLPRPRPVPNTELDRLLHEFSKHLEQARGHAPTTLMAHTDVARRFLSTRLGAHRRLRLAALTGEDASEFLTRCGQDFGPGRVRHAATTLRHLFRFLHLRGDTTINWAESVPTIPRWSLSGVPKFLSADQVDRLLRHCDRRTAIGRRDFAVLQLLVRLGLRAGEVVALTLDDITWDEGQIAVRGKGPQMNRLPLPQEAGEALVAYLQRGRPRCSSRRVFVRTKAPYIGFARAGAVGHIVRRAIRRAGLSPPSLGAHLLRHTLATQMLRRGASLVEIGQILRHRHPDTTAIYAKVDLAQLSDIAQPWPGGAP